jgi:hypothetical protein
LYDKNTPKFQCNNPVLWQKISERKAQRMYVQEFPVTIRALQTTFFPKSIIVAIFKRLALPVSKFFSTVFDIKLIVLGSKVQNNGTCFWYPSI